MKKKSAKSRSRSRTPSAEKRPVEEEKKEEPLPPPIDTQRLTLSDQEVLDVDLVLTPTRKLPDGTIEGVPFVPDDASSDAQEADESEEVTGLVLSENLIGANLSNLNTSADGTKITFLNLILPGFGIENIGILSEYAHLQKIELQYNNISDLSPLSSMQFLIELDVSHNEIQHLLDFKPPINLRNVNFSHNEITEIPDLSEFPHLQSLNIDHNQISEISGLQACRSLKKLSLSYNIIAKIQGLDKLRISHLSLGHNSILEIEGIETLHRLQYLDLSGNRIASLTGLENHSLLSEIDLEDNEISSIDEIQHVAGLDLLRKLNLMRNPVMSLEAYRLHVLFRVPQLTELDHNHVDVEEKVSAVNLFNAPPELQATLDHITHTVYSFLQPMKVYECTLPNITMPYPMLILTGPQATGKSELCHRLVQEFSDFFGYGISHTTKNPNDNETDGKDYYFVTPDEFHNLVRQGCFIQTCKIGDNYFGLSMDAVENVAKEGLACVVHMEAEGVRTLKNTYFEPRYVLIMPFDASVHEEKLMEHGITDALDIKHITKTRSRMYQDINRDNPGYFDMTINADKLADAYDRLRLLVMDYLGMSEGTDTGANQPIQHSTTIHREETNTQRTTTSGNVRRTWSRPSFVGDSTGPSNDGVSTKNKNQSIKTPVEKASLRRRESAAKEAIEGTAHVGLFEFFPRPMVPMTAPAIMEGSPMTQGAAMYKDPSFIAATLYPTAGRQPILRSPDSSSDTSSDVDNETGSSLTGLSSPRDFSEGEENPSEKKRGSKIPDLPTLLSTELGDDREADLNMLALHVGSAASSQRFEDSPSGIEPSVPILTESNTLNSKPVLPPIMSQPMVI